MSNKVSGYPWLRLSIVFLIHNLKSCRLEVEELQSLNSILQSQMSQTKQQVIDMKQDWKWEQDLALKLQNDVEFKNAHLLSVLETSKAQKKLIDDLQSELQCLRSNSVTEEKSEKSDVKFGFIKQVSAQQIELYLTARTQELELAKTEMEDQKSQILQLYKINDVLL